MFAMAAFNNLPMEIHEQIAGYLDSDQDLCTFTLICPESHNAVHSVRSGVWRALYAKRFDLAESKCGKEIMLDYMLRSRELRKGACFETGQTRPEINCLEVLRDLVVESFIDVQVGRKAKRPSKNLLQIRRFLQTSNFLGSCLSVVNRSKYTHPLLRILQLIFTHWQLDGSVESPCLGFSHSQKAVYAHPKEASLFLDKTLRQINVQQVMHVANFFKSHIKIDGEHLLFDAFCNLQDNEKPGSWDRRLFQGPGVQKLGRRWRGSYGYLPKLEEVSRLRSLNLFEDRDEYFVDVLDSEEGIFGCLDLDFSSVGNSVAWPQVFEDHLHALPPVHLCKLLNPTSNDIYSSQQLRHCRPLNLNLRSAMRPSLPIETPPPTPNGNIPISHAVLNSPQIQLPDSPPCSPILTSPRKGLDYLQFSGTGVDYEEYSICGIVHPLLPQQGIPGWQRLSMMKFAASQPTTPSDQTSSSPSLKSTASVPSADSTFSFQHSTNPTSGPLDNQWDFGIDTETWAYEGIVLPGGALILGRWWSPLDDEERRSTGPFIFWNVPDDEMAVA